MVFISNFVHIILPLPATGQLAQTERRFLGDYYMVEERDFKEFPDVEQPLGYVPIGLRRGRAAAGVVVREDDRRGPRLRAAR